MPYFRSTYQALLARGIAVFGPNVRGSSGFGKKFVNLDNGALRVNAIKDLKSCVDYLVNAGITDPKRIGIMGGSYGGYMVMAGLSEYPDIFAAGANLYGVVNFETFFAHTEPWMAAISKVEYGDPEKEKEMLKNLSPIHKVDRVKAATIVLHGANDTNVPVVEAEQVVENLKKRNVPVEYVLFPDEGHGFQKTPNRIRSTVAIVRWFEKYLNGVQGENQTHKTTPESVVRNFYDFHFSHDMGFTPEAVKQRSAWLTPEMLEACRAYFAIPQNPEEPPMIDGDPFTNTQEYPSSLSVGVANTKETSSRVDVTFTWKEAGVPARKAVVLLKMVGGKWLIDDIEFADRDSMRKLLATNPVSN